MSRNKTRRCKRNQEVNHQNEVVDLCEGDDCPSSHPSGDILIDLCSDEEPTVALPPVKSDCGNKGAHKGRGSSDNGGIIDLMSDDDEAPEQATQGVRIKRESRGDQDTPSRVPVDSSSSTSSSTGGEQTLPNVVSSDLPRGDDARPPVHEVLLSMPQSPRDTSRVSNAFARSLPSSIATRETLNVSSHNKVSERPGHASATIAKVHSSQRIVQRGVAASKRVHYTGMVGKKITGMNEEVEQAKAAEDNVARTSDSASVDSAAMVDRIVQEFPFEGIDDTPLNLEQASLLDYLSDDDKTLEMSPSPRRGPQCTYGVPTKSARRHLRITDDYRQSRQSGSISARRPKRKCRRLNAKPALKKGRSAEKHSEQAAPSDSEAVLNSLEGDDFKCRALLVGDRVYARWRENNCEFLQIQKLVNLVALTLLSRSILLGKGAQCRSDWKTELLRDPIRRWRHMYGFRIPNSPKRRSTISEAKRR